MWSFENMTCVKLFLFHLVFFVQLMGGPRDLKAFCTSGLQVWGGMMLCFGTKEDNFWKSVGLKSTFPV